MIFFFQKKKISIPKIYLYHLSIKNYIFNKCDAVIIGKITSIMDGSKSQCNFGQPKKWSHQFSNITGLATNIKASLRGGHSTSCKTKERRQETHRECQDEFELCVEGRSYFVLDVPFDLRYHPIFLFSFLFLIEYAIFLRVFVRVAYCKHWI